MGFDYEAKSTAVVNALKDYNTTTSSPDLSSGMTTRVKNVLKDDPETIGIKPAILPAVFVRVRDKEEEFSAVGNTGPSGQSKFANVTYDVIGIYMKDGANSTHANLLTEVYRLAENIEAVFQAEMQLSSTAMWCNPTRTDFSGVYSSNGIYVKGVQVTLEARYFFR